jgi:DNA-binding NarL/FixJ family response regulator
VIEIAVVDAGRVFAEAVAARLSAEPDLVVRCAVTSAAALRRAEAPVPVDVVVCDAALFDPVCAGADRTAVRFVLVADRSETGLLPAALRAGVRGWVPREASAEELLAAVRAAYAGGTWVPPRLLTGALAELTGRGGQHPDARVERLDRLTQRERDVLSCLAEGLSRADTATRLHLSPNTVRTHVQNILAKLGVNSSVAAVTLAQRKG